MRFDAENCLGGFWVQSNEFPHTSTEPRENYAMTTDSAGDYLYILREKQLLKVGTGAGEHITFEGRVYHSAELAQFGRIACLQNKLYLYSSVFANAAEAVVDVYDATSLAPLIPLVVPVPVQGKLLRPVDIVTDGTNLYLVHLIEQMGNDQHVILVHELNADNRTSDQCYFSFLFF